MKRKLLNKTHLILFSAFILAIALMPVRLQQGVRIFIVFPILMASRRLTGCAMHIDDATGEVYVADPATQSIVIFNNVGMQIYDFDTSEFGRVMDFAVDNGGQFPDFNISVWLCCHSHEMQLPRRICFEDRIQRHSARNRIELFPKSFFLNKNNRFYLASDGAMKVVVTDINGIFESSYDLKSMLKLDEKTLQSSTGIFGLTVDNAGRILFTIPSAFSMYIVSPDGTWTSFGQHGSTPGNSILYPGLPRTIKGTYM